MRFQFSLRVNKLSCHLKQALFAPKRDDTISVENDAIRASSTKIAVFWAKWRQIASAAD